MDLIGRVDTAMNRYVVDDHVGQDLGEVFDRETESNPLVGQESGRVHETQNHRRSVSNVRRRRLPLLCRPAVSASTVRRKFA